MTRAGRRLYEQRCPYSRAWEDMTAVDRRWWDREADARPFTWPQRLAIWALLVTVVWGAGAAVAVFRGEG